MGTSSSSSMCRTVGRFVVIAAVVVVVVVRFNS